MSNEHFELNNEVGVPSEKELHVPGYIFPTSVERLAETGMVRGDVAEQQDTGQYFWFDGTIWVPFGSPSRVTVTNVTTTGNIEFEDHIIEASSLGGDIDLNLPPVTNQMITVKNLDPTYAVRIVPNGTDKIELSGPYSLSAQFNSVTLYGNPASGNWGIIAKV